MAKVLIIDDDPVALDVLTEQVLAAGHQPLGLAPGDALLRELEARDFDLVLTDLHMPAVTGWKVAAWLTRHRPQVPVVAVTGHFGKDLDPAWVNRFVGMLRKPATIDEIRTVIAVALGGMR